MLTVSPLPIGGSAYRGDAYQSLGKRAVTSDQIDAVPQGHAANVELITPLTDLIGASANAQPVGFPGSGVFVPTGSGTIFNGTAIPFGARAGVSNTFRIRRGP